MIPLSCTNCCYNALQYDTIGTSFGFCTEHKKVLHAPSELTCGRLLRKDLLIPSARQQKELHREHYTPSAVCSIRTQKVVGRELASNNQRDLKTMRDDIVASVVADYGRLETKIVSLAQLKMLPGSRAELALLSLGRGYVGRCVERGGRWTSGLHLLWWTGAKLGEEPQVELKDLRVELPLPIARQVELAKWSIIMLRLTFVSDVGHHASTTRDRVSRLSRLAEDAALEVDTLSPAKLLRWINREGRKRFYSALPERTYERLREELHKSTDDSD